MCGFFITTNKYKDGILDALRTLSRRGPDEQNYFASSRYIFGHTRLSIQGLSSSGSQPLETKCGRYILLFNGEVYNYKQLVSNLKKKSRAQLSGNSDTELLGVMISELGLNATLPLVYGMYSIVLYDKKEDVLFCARDFHGQKPLFYGSINGKFAAGSDPIALCQVLGEPAQLDPTALHFFRKYRGIPAPYCIIAGMKKILPNTIVCFKLKEISGGVRYEILSNAEIYHNSETVQDTIFGNLLEKVVSEHLIADVPTAVTLSGGIDSTAVAKAIKSVKTKSSDAFFINFTQQRYSEEEYASYAAKKLGFSLHQKDISVTDYLEAFQDIPEAFPEPVADTSIIPTMVLSNFIGKNYKVALTGDGGDETFLGYTKYQTAQKFWRISSLFPKVEWVSKLANAANTSRQYKLRKLHHILRSSDAVNVHDNIMRNYFLDDARLDCHFLDLVEKTPHQVLSMANRDRKLFLEALILPKTDRSGMWHSLELRAPLLDKRIFDWSRSYGNIVSQTKPKVVLKEYLKGTFDNEFLNRKKNGFSMPTHVFLEYIKKANFINITEEHIWYFSGFNEEIFRDVSTVISNYRYGETDFCSEVWTVVCFAIWFDKVYSKINVKQKIFR